MDLGVGGFITSLGLVSNKAREREPEHHKKLKHHFWVKLGIALKSLLPVLVLGFGRFIMIKLVNYQVKLHGLAHVGHSRSISGARNWIWCSLEFLYDDSVCELGWLAFEWCSYCVHGSDWHWNFDLYDSPNLLHAYLTHVVYQTALTWGLEEYIAHAPRLTFISQNKEGLSSLFGFIGLFLISSHVGKWMEWFDSLCMCARVN